MLGSRAVKILLLGANGQLGSELRGPLSFVGELIACSREEADLADMSSLQRALDAHSPELIVNAAAYTDVDGAEKDPGAARAVNRDAVAFLGEEAKTRKIALLHYSTDFVFDGKKGAAYDERDTAAPLNIYGQSKREGEEALEELDAPAIILRTAWVYSLRHKSFVTAMLRLAREREELRVVDDQIGSPTFARDLAVASVLLVHGLGGDIFQGFSQRRGIYHLAGRGEVSRYEFARTILDLDPHRSEQRVKAIVPIPSSEYPLPAERPRASALKCAKLEERFGIRLPGWRDSLERALIP